MIQKKVLYIALGFAAGFFAAGIFSVPQVWAQYGRSSSSGYDEDTMKTKVPASYGKLIGIDGVFFYFQGDGGKVYILKQRTQSEFDSKVTVIERGE